MLSGFKQFILRNPPQLGRGSIAGRTVIEGIGLVIVVLMLFLGSPRSALVVAVTIPLAVVSIFVLMNASHMSASMLSLGALDFPRTGATVDSMGVLGKRKRP